MLTGTKRQFLNATRKATRVKPDVTQAPSNGLRPVATFFVESSGRQQPYTVVVGGGEYHCNCDAGKHDQPCYHAARVWQLAHSEGGLLAVRSAW